MKQRLRVVLARKHTISACQSRRYLRSPNPAPPFLAPVTHSRIHTPAPRQPHPPALTLTHSKTPPQSRHQLPPHRPCPTHATATAPHLSPPVAFPNPPAALSSAPGTPRTSPAASGPRPGLPAPPLASAGIEPGIARDAARKRRPSATTSCAFPHVAVEVEGNGLQKLDSGFVFDEIIRPLGRFHRQAAGAKLVLVPKHRALVRRVPHAGCVHGDILVNFLEENSLRERTSGVAVGPAGAAGRKTRSRPSRRPRARLRSRFRRKRARLTHL